MSATQGEITAYPNEAPPDILPIMDSNGVHHVAVFVRDCERSIAFYRDGLGFTVRRQRKSDRDIRGAMIEVLSSPPYPVKILFVYCPDDEEIKFFEER